MYQYACVGNETRIFIILSKRKLIAVRAIEKKKTENDIFILRTLLENY